MIKLSEIVFEDLKLNKNDKQIKIKGLSSDSRNIKSGYLFASLSEKADKYIINAVNNGAVALLLSNKVVQRYSNIKKIVIIDVDDPKEFYGLLCSRYYNLKYNNIVAVTGTNGKTSVAWFVNNFWNKIGIKSLSIGTLGIFDGKDFHKTLLTTPDIDNIYLKLSKYNKKGFKNAIIEASSHGIDQKRLAGLNISIAVITSLSRDHLDYHVTFENYKKAKLKLFSSISSNGVAIINDSIEDYKDFVKEALKNNLKVITVGEKETSDWFYKINNFVTNRQLIEIIYKGKKIKVYVNLIGNYQINNLVTSMAILIETGVKFDSLVKNIENISAPPGRMEFIGDKKGAKIYVDYAHTPDALKNVLISIRPYVSGKLCIIFGCGGDRDTGKRPIMGKIAHNYADIIYITDDNPRNEDSEVIRKSIITSCPNAIEIADRRIAIFSAIKVIKEGDILLVLGKGNEETQIVKNNYKYFSDKEEILSVLSRDH